MAPTEDPKKIIANLKYELGEAEESIRCLVEEVSRVYEEINVLYEISTYISPNLDEETLFKKYFVPALNITNARLAVMLLRKEQGDYAIAFTYGDTEDLDMLLTPEAIAKLVLVASSGHTQILDKRNFFTDALCAPLMTEEGIVAIGVLLEKQDGGSFYSGELKIFNSLMTSLATIIANKKLYANLRKIFYQTIKALADVIDANDPYTRGHSGRVAEYAAAIASELQLSKQEIEGIHLAGLLHDIGKISIPTEILRKNTHLTDDEYALVQRHPHFTYEILSNIDFDYDVPLVAKYHHERPDGTGYPLGVKQSQIPVGARIIAMADSFDAMTSDRPYRKALKLPKVIREIKANQGLQFDPRIAWAFTNIIRNELQNKTAPILTKYCPLTEAEKKETLKLLLLTEDDQKEQSA